MQLKYQILANHVKPDQTSSEYINITVDGIYRRNASSGKGSFGRVMSILHKLQSLKFKLSWIINIIWPTRNKPGLHRCNEFYNVYRHRMD